MKAGDFVEVNVRGESSRYGVIIRVIDDYHITICFDLPEEKGNGMSTQAKLHALCRKVEAMPYIRLEGYGPDIVEKEEGYEHTTSSHPSQQEDEANEEPRVQPTEYRQRVRRN